MTKMFLLCVTGLLAAAIVMSWHGSANAQASSGAKIVTSCGVATFPTGALYPLTMDVNGNLCGSGQQTCPSTGCTASIGTVYPGAPVTLGINTCTSACTNVSVIPATATLGLQSLQLQVTSPGTGVSAILQGSNDPDCPTANNWSATGIGMAAVVGNPTATVANVTNLNFLGVVVAPITTNCIRVVVTAYSSGTYTIQGFMSPAKSNVESILGPVSLYAIPGNGISYGQSLTGTTGALAPAMAAVSATTNYLCHIDLTSSGTTTPGLFPVTVTGLANPITTLNFYYWAPTTGQGELKRDFNPCLKAIASNTAITLNAPALGAGTAAYSATIAGFQY